MLLQYIEFLTSPSIIAPDDYAKKILPSLSDLNQLYGIAPPICMLIIRPVLNLSLLVRVYHEPDAENSQAIDIDCCFRDAEEGARGERRGGEASQGCVDCQEGTVRYFEGELACRHRDSDTCGRNDGGEACCNHGRCIDGRH